MTGGFLSPRRSRQEPKNSKQKGTVGKESHHKSNNTKTSHVNSSVYPASVGPSSNHNHRGKATLQTATTAPASLLQHSTSNTTKQTGSSHGKVDVANNIHHTNSLNESVHSDTKEQNDYESNTDPTVLSKIYDEIASHRQGNTSIKTYYKQLKAIWDESAPTFTDSLDAIDEEQIELMEREKLMQFLMGINVSYSSVCSQILRSRPSPTVENAYTQIIQEQKNRKLAKRNTM